METGEAAESLGETEEDISVNKMIVTIETKGDFKDWI